MKKSFMLVAAILVFAFVAAAQEVPKFETFLGYTYVRFSTSGDAPSFSANGGSGQFVWNFSKWIGAVADLGAVHNNGFGGLSIDNTQAFFMFGPRVSIHKWSRFKPYAQAVFGGVAFTASTRLDLLPAEDQPANPILPIIPGEPITARLRYSQNAFAMALGGGLDIKINKHFSVRPVGLDYYYTRLNDLRLLGDNSQNNLRYTAGINFLFGAR